MVPGSLVRPASNISPVLPVPLAMSDSSGSVCFEVTTALSLQHQHWIPVQDPCKGQKLRLRTAFQMADKNQNRTVYFQCNEMLLQAVLMDLVQ